MQPNRLHLAEDLVQHTFLQLYRHWKGLDPASLDAYARRTLVNAYLPHKRDRRKETVVADPPDRAALDERDVAGRLAKLRGALDPAAFSGELG